MKCPNCCTAIHLDIRDQIAYPEKTQRGGEKEGIEVGHGFCPECNQLIVFVRHGNCRFVEDRTELVSARSEEVIYPRIVRRCGDPEVPSQYREMFNEAASVLQISAKASAALSRRLLQVILRDEYAVSPGDLSNEIEQLLQRSDIPSSIKEEVDAIRNVGNFAAHPNKYKTTGEIVDVEPGEAEWLVEILEHLFDHRFVGPTREQERRERLNAKLSDLGKPLMK